MVDLKGQILDNFHLEGCGGLQRTDFGLLADLTLHVTSYRIQIVICLSVDCHTGKSMSEVANFHLSSCNQAVLSSLSVLAPLSSVSSIAHHTDDAINFMYCIHIS